MFYFGLEVSHPGYTHKSEAYCTQSLKARQAVNSAKSDTDRDHKEWNHHVRGTAFNALPKQTHNTRATRDGREGRRMRFGCGAVRSRTSFSGSSVGLVF